MKSKPIAFIIVAALVLFMLPVTAFAATVYPVANATDLTSSLSSAASGDTIKLTANINYTSGIVITGKSITFDLNGYTLDVSNASGNALDVGSGGVVSLAGSGAFNVSTSATGNSTTSYFGVYAHNGGQATVTNATIASPGVHDACAASVITGSTVHVLGNCLATGSSSMGAITSGGAVVIEGNVTANNNANGLYCISGNIQVKGSVSQNADNGAGVINFGGSVQVTGNVSASGDNVESIFVTGSGSSVQVTGNVSANGNAADGVDAESGGTAKVTGNVTATGTQSIGVYGDQGGTATIDGTITAPNYIQFGESTPLTAANGVQGTGSFANYLKYTDGTNTVYVKHVVSTPSSSAPAAASITVTPASLTLYVGGRGTLTPSAKGGAWTYDKSFITLTQNADGTVTIKGLKPGTVTLHYSVGWASEDVTVIIKPRSLPQTGQDFTPVYILLALAGCALAGIALAANKKKKAKSN